MSDAKLRAKLKAVQEAGIDPSWWLEVYMASAEEAGDWDAAIRIADEYCHDNPKDPNDVPDEYAAKDVAELLGCEHSGARIWYPVGDRVVRVSVVHV